jgi:hypothetical protein
MNRLEKQRQEANFVDVVEPLSSWDYAENVTVYRFPNDETGHGRAVDYRNAYNESLREAIGVTDADLELQPPDSGQRPGEFDRACKAERYRDHMAHLEYVKEENVIGNDDPMPTDYPHDF